VRAGDTRGGAIRLTTAALPCPGMQRFPITWRGRSVAISAFQNHSIGVPKLGTTMDWGRFRFVHR
jgi:hypothetical protein